MKTKDGYTVYRNDDKGYGYYLKEFIVDGQNPQDDKAENIERGLFDMYEIDCCRNKSEVKELLKRYKNKYYKLVVYENIVEADINEYGYAEKYCTVSQKIYEYRKGKLVYEC